MLYNSFGTWLDAHRFGAAKNHNTATHAAYGSSANHLENAKQEDAFSLEEVS